MSLKKKILLIFSLLLLVVFLCRVAFQMYVDNLQSFAIERYELSDSEMIKLNDKILALNSVEERALFLESMYAIDQEVRADETTSIEKYGYDSNEHANALLKMDSVDAVNLYLAKRYLDTYGYPDVSSFDETAVYTPLLIFHHQSDFEAYKKYFHYFYSAYQEGHISAHRLSFSLNRKYMIKFGKQFQTEGKSYTDEEKIIKFIDLLDLH